MGGRQAVVLFFIMSGFYMAMVLKSKYTGRRGISTFYISRYIRLWPGYLASLILAGILNNTFVKIADRIQDCSIPTKLLVWFSNIFILGADFFFSIRSGDLYLDPFILSPKSNGLSYLVNHPIFTVAIELMFYLLAPFFIRNIKSIFIVFAIATAYHIGLSLTGNANEFFRYHAFSASFFYFALGGMAFHFYQDFKNNRVKYSHFLMVAASVLICPLMYYNWAILGFVFMIPVLFELTKRSKIDRFLGDLSFLVYILHYPILEYTWSHHIGFIKGQVGYFVAGSTLILSVILYFLLEKRLDNYRQKLIVRLLKKH